MAILPKREVLPLPSRRTVDELEAQIGSHVRAQLPAMREQGDGAKIERAKELLSNGLGHVHEDGAKKLELAITAATEETARLHAAIDKLDEAMNTLKLKTASNILDLKSKSSQLTAEVEARVQHVASMVRWSDEQEAILKSPPRPALPLDPSPPAATEVEHEHDDETPETSQP